MLQVGWGTWPARGLLRPTWVRASILPILSLGQPSLQAAVAWGANSSHQCRKKRWKLKLTNWALVWCVSEVPQEIMKCNYCISWCNSSTWIAVIFHDAHGVPEVHGVQCCTRSTLIPNVPEMPGMLRLPGVLPLLVLLPQAAPLPYPCQHLVFAQDSFNSCDRNQDLSFSHLVHWAFWAHPQLLLWVPLWVNLQEVNISGWHMCRWSQVPFLGSGLEIGLGNLNTIARASP